MATTSKRSGGRLLRIAIIYDNTARPDTTGEYCRRALEELGHAASHFLPREADQIAPIYDLYLRVDDDLDLPVPRGLRPLAYWTLDTHRDYARRLVRAREADYVFCAQRNAAQRMRTDGLGRAFWLPLACEPAVHRRIPGVAKEYDVCFVGNTFPGDGERTPLVEWIRSMYPRAFIGNAYGEQMARIYTAAKLVFNCAIRDDVNMRVFEAAACGSLLLTNDLAGNGQDLLFTSGQHLITYRTAEELATLIPRYLTQEAERERIAEAGMRHAHACHAYRNRMEDLLAAIFQGAAPEAKYPVETRQATWHLGAQAARHSGSAQAPQGLSAVVRAAEGQPGTRAPGHPGSAGVPECRGAGVPSPEGRPLASIIIPTYNNLPLTQQCVASIRRCTGLPYEILIVDNGSEDGTAAWAQCEGLRVIANPENRGFPAACNQGLLAVEAPYLVLLNNDTVVSPGWLARLLAHADADPATGLVAPSTNFAASPQQVAASYATDEEFLAFAAETARCHAGRAEEVARLIGVCLLIPRRVLQAVGLLDERFGLGNFEDNDYCLRVRMAGYRLLVARDVFIHHQGHQTFRLLGERFDQLLEENKRRFLEKWDASRYTSVDRAAAPVQATPVSGLGADTAAWDLLRAGRAAEAYEAFEGLVRHTPADARAWLGLGLAAELRGVPAAAVQAFAVSLQLAPGNPDAEKALARAQAAAPQGPPAGNGPSTPEKPAGYFDHARPEIQALVPTTARRVLDVGCGAGRLGEALKATAPREVIGIECDPAQAARARARLDEVLVGDAETLALPFPPGTFDCVICADVLEHLRDPWALLARLRPLLAPQGLLLASIPNAQFVQVLWELAQGRWSYQPAGILDRTHLRFFTRREFRRALRAAGFQEAAWHPQIPASLAPLLERAGGQSVTLAMEPLRIGRVSPESLQDLLTVQFVVAASPIPATEGVPQEEEPLPHESTISILLHSPDGAARGAGPVGSASPWDLLQAGKFPEAYDAFEALVRAEPRNTRNLLGLGLAAEARGVPAAAALAYRTLLQMDPQDADARRGLERVGDGTGAAAAGSIRQPVAS